MGVGTHDRPRGRGLLDSAAGTDRCDDEDPCTLDICDGGCQNPAAPDGTPCGEIVQCETIDLCVAQICTPFAIPDDAPCDDGDICTLPDTCAAGTCVGIPTTLPPTVTDEVVTGRSSSPACSHTSQAVKTPNGYLVRTNTRAVIELSHNDDEVRAIFALRTGIVDLAPVALPDDEVAVFERNPRRLSIYARDDLANPRRIDLEHEVRFAGIAGGDLVACDEADRFLRFDLVAGDPPTAPEVIEGLCPEDGFFVPDHLITKDAVAGATVVRDLIDDEVQVIPLEGSGGRCIVSDGGTGLWFSPPNLPPRRYDVDDVSTFTELLGVFEGGFVLLATADHVAVTVSQVFFVVDVATQTQLETFSGFFRPIYMDDTLVVGSTDGDFSFFTRGAGPNLSRAEPIDLVAIGFAADYADNRLVMVTSFGVNEFSPLFGPGRRIQHARVGTSLSRLLRSPPTLYARLQEPSSPAGLPVSAAELTVVDGETSTRLVQLPTENGRLYTARGTGCLIGAHIDDLDGNARLEIQDRCSTLETETPSIVPLVSVDVEEPVDPNNVPQFVASETHAAIFGATEAIAWFDLTDPLPRHIISSRDADTLAMDGPVAAVEIDDVLNIIVVDSAQNAVRSSNLTRTALPEDSRVLAIALPLIYVGSPTHLLFYRIESLEPFGTQPFPEEHRIELPQPRHAFIEDDEIVVVHAAGVSRISPPCGP